MPSIPAPRNKPCDRLISDDIVILGEPEGTCHECPVGPPSLVRTLPCATCHSVIRTPNRAQQEMTASDAQLSRIELPVSMPELADAGGKAGGRLLSDCCG